MLDVFTARGEVNSLSEPVFDSTGFMTQAVMDSLSGPVLDSTGTDSTEGGAWAAF